MILDKKINVKMSHWYIDHYRNLGYKVEKKDVIEVPIDHLAENDPVNVNAKCDKCGNIKEVRYKDYLVNKANHYFSCSYECSRDKVKMTNIEKYGVENPFQNDEIKEKIKETCIEKFGTERASQSDVIKEKVKNTNVEKFGVEYRSQLDDWSDTLKEAWSNKTEEEIKEIMDRKAKTNLEKYGVEHVLQVDFIREALKEYSLREFGVDHHSKAEEMKKQKEETFKERYGIKYALQYKDFKNKATKTCLERYGVENAMQDINIFKRQQKSAFIRKRFKGTDIHYQGSYELDFLEKYHDKMKIENGISVKYQYEDKNKVYHSDFYLPEFNLIVEIKSSYTYNKELELNLAKEKACLEQGYNFIFIINKEYKDFLYRI
jgi:hypothetical protein